MIYKQDKNNILKENDNNNVISIKTEDDKESKELNIEEQKNSIYNQSIVTEKNEVSNKLCDENGKVNGKDNIVDNNQIINSFNDNEKLNQSKNNLEDEKSLNFSKQNNDGLVIENINNNHSNKNIIITKDNNIDIKEKVEIINIENQKLVNSANTNNNTNINISDNFNDINSKKNFANVQIDLNEDSSSSDYDIEEKNFNYIENKRICGIKNIGNNCYLNSGLQIIVSCVELVDLLQQDKYKNNKGINYYLRKTIKKLLNKNVYDPKEFIKYFCEINTDFTIGTQCCSQTFIRTLIGNINQECIDNKFDLIYNNNQYKCPKSNDNYCKQYEKFIEKLYPESKAQSLFSGITKSESKGKCPHCQETIEKYSFNYFIDQIIYLDDFKGEHKFSEILNANIGIASNLIIDCPKCNNEINLKQDTKFIKLPNILIFTLERYHGFHNKVSIIPDSILQMNKYIDKSLNIDNTSYELFAINIRFGSTEDYGHEICQVKRNSKWYEINDNEGYEIKEISHFDSSYGLFYRLKTETDDKISIYSKSIKLVDQKTESFFTKFRRYIPFMKEEYNPIQIKQGIYIISETNIFESESKLNYPNDYNLLNLLKEVIFKIKKEGVYEANNFIKEFLKINSNYKENKNTDSLDFLNYLIKNINDEFIRTNYNLYDENIIKYIPICEQEKIEYTKFIKTLFPISKPLFLFSNICKIYTKGKCKCGNKINEYKYENFIVQKISVNKIFSSIHLSKLLQQFLYAKKKRIKCEKCQTMNMKLNIEQKYIKLGDILIISIINNYNQIKILADEISFDNYLDDSLINDGNNYRYELFCINSKINKDDKTEALNCKIKINEQFYDINNINDDKTYDENIYELFYRKIK